MSFVVGLNRAPALSELQPEAVEARLRAGKKTPHLEAYIAWFNRLSQLIASSICVLKKKKKRVKVIGRRTVTLGWFAYTGLDRDEGGFLGVYTVPMLCGCVL